MSEPLVRPSALLFDMDGTLYNQPMLRGLMAVELAGLPFLLGSTRAAMEAIRTLQAFRFVREAMRHDVPADKQLGEWQFVLAGERAGVSAETVEGLVTEWMYRRPLKYLPFCKRRGLDRVFDVMSRLGIKIGVFSDYPVQDKIRALGLEAHVTVSLCATDPEINALKPNPKGYLHACRLWNLPPAQVFYVGDRIEVDAAGAAAAGMPCAIIGRSGRKEGWDHAFQDRIVTVTSFQRLLHVFDANG